MHEESEQNKIKHVREIMSTVARGSSKTVVSCRFKGRPDIELM